jgi:hypothetical protein
MVLAAVLAGCVTPPPLPTLTLMPTATVAPAQPTATAAAVQEPSQVYVERVDVHLLESFPVQVRIVVAGYMADACTTVNGAETQRAGSRLRVTLTTTRTGELCAQVLTPFEQSISLDVNGLPGGSYTVDVHGITTDVVLPDFAGSEPGIESAVTHVLALVTTPIYTAQDPSSIVVGALAAGTVVRVTGKDPIGLWWRIVCPDNTVGDCWVSADPTVTQPTTP